MESFKNLFALLLSISKYTVPAGGIFLNNIYTQVLSMVALFVILVVDMVRLLIVLKFVASERKQGRVLKRIKYGVTELEFESVQEKSIHLDDSHAGLRVVK